MKCAMLPRLFFALTAFALVTATSMSVTAQTQTVGLFVNDTASYSGYTLFAPMQTKSAYLVDPFGRLVHSWDNVYSPGAGVYFLPNGHLLWSVKIPTTGGYVQEFDWDGNLVWEWQDEDPAYRQHHDIEPMPNGNVLILTNYYRTAAEVLAAGRDPLRLTADTIRSILIREIQPTGPNSGDVVWEWYLWDHLIQDFDNTKDNYGVVADHPELLDVNIGSTAADWIHSNSVAYNPELDQVVVGCRTISEIFVIDHSTTTAEAAGHTGGARGRGGDFIYRWGNPQNYDAGDAGDQTLDYQHDPHWIPAGLPGEGNMLVFNNGNTRRYSSVDEVILPYDGSGGYTWPSPGEPFGPVAATWTWQDSPVDSFFASLISGVQRLPNGNTLINDGPVADFFEVSPSGEIVWRYVSPMGSGGPVDQGTTPPLANVFRAYRFGADFPGFVGKDLTPTATLEGYPIIISGSAVSPAPPVPADTAFTITAEVTAVEGFVATVTVLVDAGAGFESVPMYDDGLHGDGAAGDDVFGTVVPRPSVSTTVLYYLEAENTMGSGAVYDPVNPPLTVYRFETGYPCGNVDGLPGTGPVTNVSDLTYLVAFLFQGGPPPPDEAAANVDGSSSGGGLVNVSDLTYLVAYLFQGGPPPSC